MAAVLEVVGFGLLVFGLWLLAPWLALVVAGSLIVLGANVMEKRR